MACHVFAKRSAVPTRAKTSKTDRVDHNMQSPCRTLCALPRRSPVASDRLCAGLDDSDPEDRHPWQHDLQHVIAVLARRDLLRGSSLRPDAAKLEPKPDANPRLSVLRSCLQHASPTWPLSTSSSASSTWPSSPPPQRDDKCEDASQHPVARASPVESSLPLKKRRTFDAAALLLESPRTEDSPVGLRHDHEREAQPHAMASASRERNGTHDRVV